MATYGFYKYFVRPIAEGVKYQTIRHARKYPPKPGDRIKMKCAGRIFGEAEITRVLRVEYRKPDEIRLPDLEPAEGVLKMRNVNDLAGRDGLSLSELIKFLRKYARDNEGWNSFIAIIWKDFVKKVEISTYGPLWG